MVNLFDLPIIGYQIFFLRMVLGRSGVFLPFFSTSLFFHNFACDLRSLLYLH